MSENKPKQRRPRQRYSPQFKDQAVERAAKDGVPRVAKDLGIPESMLYYWRSQKSKSGTTIETQKIQQAEMARLKREKERLQEENAFLKKWRRNKDSPVIDYHECVSTKSPRQGERAPGVFIDKPTRLYDHLRNTQHNILLFTDLSVSNKTIGKIKETQQWLSKTYSDLIKIHIISTSKLEDFKNNIIDVNAAAHKTIQREE